MKRFITIFVMLLVSAGYVFGFNVYENAQAEKIGGTRVHQNQLADTQTVNVYLQRVYLDGQTTVDIQPVTVESMKALQARFSDWKLVDQAENKVVFEKKIHDISPLLKASGYFGISPKGILTIYKGKPAQKKAVHSFFQLDVKELESDIQRELRQGIPVETKDHYRKVLKTMKTYAIKKEQ